MKWRSQKTVKTSPFLVLPIVEAIKHNQKETMPKNPGLRLFTKTHHASKLKENHDQNSRPLTATLDKPQVLDIRLITKIDMSLVRKEFLTIANLCRVPISVQKVRRKPSVFNQKRTNNRAVKLCAQKMHPNQKPTRKTSSNDGNNNNCATYRVTRKKRIDNVTTKLPQPCKTCGRSDLPERFHSHPERKMPLKEEKLPVKNVVQKPVPIKYTSKLNKTGNDAQVLGVSKSQSVSQTPSVVKKEEPKQRVVSAKGPRTLCCYICGREFGTMSLPLHEPKCLEKWDRENSTLPVGLRRKRPVKPDHSMTKEEYNNFAWESSQANLVPCKNCGRTFYPDRLAVHQRSCRPSESMAKIPGGRNNNGPVPSKPEPEIRSPDTVPPKGVHCSVCGRIFGSKSIRFHEPQCLKKWHMMNDHLPKSEREPMYSELEQAAVNKEPEEEQPVKSPERETGSGKRPPMFPCYLCGRLFSVKSIYIHEPQCLKRWHAENDKLPPSKRKPEPLKPDVKFTRDGKTDYRATAEANWQSHLQLLVPCKNCGRTFNPDRVCVHEKTCKAPPIRKFNHQDIKVEIFS